MGALPYFDVNAETTLQMDASKKGLGYASRSLTKTEQNYQNLEREREREREKERERSTRNHMGNGKVPLLLVWKGIHIRNQPEATCEYLQEAYD